MRKLLALGAVLTLAAASGCTDPKGYDDSFGRHVKAYLLDHPEVLMEMQQAYYDKQQKLAIEHMKPLIKKYSSQIFNDPRDPSIGPADAKVVVVQFFDYRCPHCKSEAAPAVLDLIKKYPDVRWVFKEFPIFGPPSQLASRAGLAAFKAGHYLPVYQGLMASPEVDQGVIDQVMAKAGIPKAMEDQLMATPALAAQVVDVQTLAAELGVDGTPAFIIGDTAVNGANMQKVEELILKGRKN